MIRFCHCSDSKFILRRFLVTHLRMSRRHKRKVKCIPCKESETIHHNPPRMTFEIRKRSECLLQKNLICDLCGVAKTSKRILKLHLETHLNLSCDVCKVPYLHKFELRIHLRSHFETNICDHCGLNFNNVVAFRKHLLTHDPNAKKRTRKKEEIGTFKCNFCPRVFDHLNARLVHEGAIHKDGKTDNHFKCTKCPKSFFSREDLRLHGFDHFTGRVRFCDFPECNKKFNGQKPLAVHQKSHFPNKHACESCGKVSSTDETFYS